MKTFKDLVFKPHPIGDGLQAIMKFDNGKSVSVVKFKGSRGYPNLWELAVLDIDGQLDYSTPITADVLGNLTEDNVTTAMNKVEVLN